VDRHRPGLHPEDGRLLEPNVVSDRFDRLVRLCDLPPIRLHDLRHTAASLAYRATRDLEMVSEQQSETAGHRWWGGWGSNPRPRDYESLALTG